MKFKYMNCQGDQNWVVILSALLPSSAFTLLVSTSVSRGLPKVFLSQSHKRQAWMVLKAQSTRRRACSIHTPLCSVGGGELVFSEDFLTHTHKGNTDQMRTPWLHFPFFPLGSSCSYHILESLKLFKLCSLTPLFLFL